MIKGFLVCHVFLPHCVAHFSNHQQYHKNEDICESNIQSRSNWSKLGIHLYNTFLQTTMVIHRPNSHNHFGFIYSQTSWQHGHMWVWLPVTKLKYVYCHPCKSTHETLRAIGWMHRFWRSFQMHSVVQESRPVCSAGNEVDPGKPNWIPIRLDSHEEWTAFPMVNMACFTKQTLKWFAAFKRPPEQKHIGLHFDSCI